MPSDVTTANRTKNGSQITLLVGVTPKNTIMASSTTNAMQKSIAPETIAAIGIASLGKYTLRTRFALLTRLSADCARPFAKNVQGTNAAKLNNGYGTPSDDKPASRPKNRLNTTIVQNG